MGQAAVDQENTNDFGGLSRATRALAETRAGTSEPPGETNPGSGDLSLEERVAEACGRLTYLLHRVAGRFARRLPAHVELADLMGAGSIGLVMAVQQHLDKPAIELKRLAEQRIRGAVLDYLRSVDHLTRRQRAAVSSLQRAQQALAGERAAEDITRVAGLMGVSVARVEHIRNRLAVVQFTSIEEDTLMNSDGLDPSQEAVRSQIRDRLASRLSELSERLQTILSLYYCESLTYKEIGDIMGISRSRICQLHTQALEELREGMKAEAA